MSYEDSLSFVKELRLAYKQGRITETAALERLREEISRIRKTIASGESESLFSDTEKEDLSYLDFLDLPELALFAPEKREIEEAMTFLVEKHLRELVEIETSFTRLMGSDDDHAGAVIGQVEKSEVHQPELTLDVNEAAQLLGLKASTIYKKTMNGEIPFYKPSGGRIHFRRKELEDWLFKNRSSTRAELELEAAKRRKRR
jgi:excisionase family DNA binding protein